MRQFESGAVRSNADGKLEYVGFLHPLVDKSFCEYMHKHQTQEDGKLRASNNWWKGWDKGISLQSLVRHVEDLKAIYAGYLVIKVRNKLGEKTQYLTQQQTINFPKGTTVEVVTEEECINAIRFNCGSYLLDLLKK